MGRTLKGRRMYVEAFPSIDIIMLEKQVKQGNRFCQWTNEHVAVVGFLEVVELAAEKMTIAYLFHGCPNVAAADSSITIKIERHDRGPHIGRPLMICPSCKELRQKLFYVMRQWECSICLDLTTVNQLYKPITTFNTREYLRLRAATSLGRLKGQQQKTFDTMVEKERKLKYQIAGAWWESEAFYMQVAHWLPNDSKVVRRVNEAHWPYSELAGSPYGFQRLIWFGVQEQYSEAVEMRRKAYRSYRQHLREERARDRAAARERATRAQAPLDPIAVAAALGLSEFDGPDEQYD